MGGAVVVNNANPNITPGMTFAEHTAIGNAPPHHQEVSAGAGIAVTAQVVALADTHLVSTGNGYTSYPATYAGLVAALVAAGSAEGRPDVEVAPGEYTGNVEVPAGITMRSRGAQAIIYGKVTLGNNSEIQDCVFVLAGDSGDTVYGLESNAEAGYFAYARECSFTTSNAGAGDTAILHTSGSGELWVTNCVGAATAASGLAYAGHADKGEIRIFGKTNFIGTDGVELNG
jgi:hypothetical protein